jgi:ATP-binding cassette subfamily B protein
VFSHAILELAAMARRTAAQAELDQKNLPKTPLNRETIREALDLARYLRPYRARFGSGLATLFLSASLGLAFPLLAGSLIDAAMHPGGVQLPWLGSPTLNQVAVLLAISVSFQALASFNSALAFNRVGQSALADLRRDCYRRLISLPMEFFARRRAGPGITQRHARPRAPGGAGNRVGVPRH